MAAERARRAIERKRFRFEGRDLSLTASFGVAQLRSSENTPLLVGRADEALYASKQAGRNKTYWHDGRSVRAASDNDAPEKLESARGKRDPQGTQAEPGDPAGQPADRPANNADNTPISRPGEAQVDTGDVLPPHPPVTHLSQCDEDSLPQCRDLHAAAGGVANRTEFCRAVQGRLAEWKRGGAGFSVILLSILDRQPNDPAQRDLQWVFLPHAPYAALTAVVREMDLVAQFKPGCFGVLLPAVDQDEAGTLAQRLRRAVQSCFATAASELKPPVIAAGLAEVAEGDDLVRLLTRTEEALQYAVQEGRGGCFRHNGQWAEAVAPLANIAAL